MFVSHATYDKFLAKVICEKIEACHENATTFRDDRDINGGDVIPEAIRDAIKQCHEFCVIMTPESAERPWVHYEMGMADMRDDVQIVPFFYHAEPNNLPAFVTRRRGYQLDEIDDYLEDLVGRIERKIT
ncbi:toll/interleukin-1 receptor domain-containing protein [Stratiformator vulcanicus]|uniref:toll/interleukin-1 receptor domain-containing protein n=1 Tax=Stratiformator vulcanicus TaxID=2527980 RepID=UPI002877301E|nr:toll/interleukin-1 receptor domain-containing protein [Stratiformator vulcanicus]